MPQSNINNPQNLRLPCESAAPAFQSHRIKIRGREVKCPSVMNAAGRRDLVCPLALAGIAAGADGLIVEVHPDPNRALTNADQTITLDMFDDLMIRVRKLSEARN